MNIRRVNKYAAAAALCHIILTLLCGHVSADTVIYGGNAYGSTDLVEIDLSFNTATAIDSLLFGTQAMAQDPETGWIYYFEWQESGDEFAYWNPATGTNSVVGVYDPPLNIATKRLAFSPEGVLYMMDNQDDLYTVDKETGDLTFIGPVSGLTTGQLNGTGDMAFSPEGTLYLVTYRNLYEVDIQSQTATLLYSEMINGPGIVVWSGLAYCDGLLYASSIEESIQGSAIFSIDPGTGVVQRLFNANILLNDLTSCSAQTPPPVNQPPVLQPIGSKSVQEGALLEFTVTATDPDGDNLTYGAGNLPPGAVFDPATRVFSWTPGLDQSGAYVDVLFSVTDDGAPSMNDSEAITITVGDVNRPPVLDPIGSKSVQEGALLEFTVTATDPDGDNLTYGAGNLPPGAVFDPATQVFSWTPDPGQAATYPDILFTVSDDGAPVMEDSEAVEIVVTPGSNTVSITLMGENVTEDNMIANSVYATLNFGGSPINLGIGSQGIVARTLMKWDISSIPAGSTILTAELSMYCFQNQSGGAITINAYRLLQPWEEGVLQNQDRLNDTPPSSSWTDYGFGEPWDAPGAGGANDRDAAIVASASGTGIGWYVWDMTSAVQNWVDGVWQNEGIVMQASNEGTANLKVFAPSENADDNMQPRLYIEYAAP
jgi:hypothetical protein